MQKFIDKYLNTTGRATMALILAVVLVATTHTMVRKLVVPSFAAVDGDYRYQWHRVDNVREWQDWPVGHRGNLYCRSCHGNQYQLHSEHGHAGLLCESCHGPAGEHPSEPTRLTIDRGRDLCLRCHAHLPYRPAGYGGVANNELTLKMIRPEEHHPTMNCTQCHNVHSAGF